MVYSKGTSMMQRISGTVVKVISHGVCEFNIDSSDCELVSKHSNHELINIKSITSSGITVESEDLAYHEFVGIIEHRKLDCTVMERDTASRLTVLAEILR